jgi:hypothetical protein
VPGAAALGSDWNGPIGFDAAVQQLRSAVGLWNVETTQYADDGAVARVACGTYRFDWIAPDRVPAGRSDIPDWKQASGLLFYVNERRATIEMASVGADGHLWVMSGPAGGSSWKPGNHQVFERAHADSGGGGAGLRYRQKSRNYVPLT